MIEERIVPKPTSVKKGTKPTVIEINGANGESAKMIRNQSIRTVARELMNMSSNQDLISVNVIGKQSTGKSEICRTLVHYIHEYDEEDWDVQFIGREEFLNLEETVKNFKPMNTLVLFDDIAFLKAGASQQQVDQIQYILSVIRHLPGGKDVRIIIFKSFQYTRSLPPFLRQNDATIVSSVDDAELKSMEETFGKREMHRIKILKRMGVQLKLGSKNQAHFDYPLGGKHKEISYFKYHAKKPFLPYYYYNGVNGRIVVSHLRTWAVPYCSICDKTDGVDKDTLDQNFADFKKEFMDIYGSRTNVVKHIVRATLLKRGINCFNSSTKSGMKKLEKYLNTHPMDLNDLMKEFGLEVKKVKIDRDIKRTEANE